MQHKTLTVILLLSTIFSVLTSCQNPKQSNQFLVYRAMPLGSTHTYIPGNSKDDYRLAVCHKDTLSYKLASKIQGKKYEVVFKENYATLKEIASTSTEVVLSRDYNGLSPESSKNSELYTSRAILGQDTVKFYLVRFLPDTASTINMTVEVYEPDAMAYTKMIWGNVACELARLKTE